MPTKKKACQAGTPLCSGSLIQTYSVNGSAKEGKTFDICGACAVYIKKGGSKLKAVQT